MQIHLLQHNITCSSQTPIQTLHSNPPSQISSKLKLKQLKTHEELDQDELKAVRRANKQKRKNKLLTSVQEGAQTVAELRKRQEGLDKKNKIAKEKKENKGVVKDRKKKMRSTELLALAGENALAGVERKAGLQADRKAGVVERNGDRNGSSGISRSKIMKEWESKTGGESAKEKAKKTKGKF
jgi:hypothetical protein